MNSRAASRAKFSIPSLIAIVAAIASFSAGAFWGLILAVVAVVAGFVGVMLAFSSEVRGGLMSAFAVVAGIIGLLAAVIKAIAWLA